MSFLEGFAIGLGMVIFIGPVFFILLNSSLQFGVKAGLAVASGIIFSDIICVLLCYYGLFSFVNREENQFWIGIVGSAIIFGLGINYLLKKAIIITSISTKPKRIKTFFLKGFSVNFFNPFVLAVWIGVFQYGQSKYLDKEYLYVFLISVLLGIFTTDVLKVLLANRLKEFISAKRLAIFFKITGCLLIFFAIRLLYLIW